MLQNIRIHETDVINEVLQNKFSIKLHKNDKHGLIAYTAQHNMMLTIFNTFVADAPNDSRQHKL